MSDVFDEDLMKELGLEPEDLQSPAVPRRRRTGRSEDEQPRTVMDEPSFSASRSQEAPAFQPEASVSPAARASVQAPVQTEAPVAPPRRPSPTPAPARPAAPMSSGSGADQDGLTLSRDVPLQLAAVLAKKSVRLKDLMDLKPGEILDFKRLPQEPIDLVAGGKLIAKAELVLVDGKVGARILKVLK